jgi:acyl-CoA synthetase (AMP-forming)/AMP-acid ligase II
LLLKQTDVVFSYLTVITDALTLFLPVRFKTACKNSALLNIYGSTEVGADASFAVLCSPDTPLAASDVTAASLCADSSQLPTPQGEGRESPAVPAHEVAKQGSRSSNRTPWMIGNAPIGYPIKGNELIIARSCCKSRESDDDTALSHSVSSGQEYFELVPDGEPGELFVGGKQLAAGYHNRPDETAKRFLTRASFVCRTCTDADADADADAGADAHGNVVGCPSSSTDRMISTDRLFRTGDIVVRISKGIDGPASGPAAGAGVYGGGEWAGALVWQGRSDLQVLALMPYERWRTATVPNLIDSLYFIFSLRKCPT